MHIASGLAFVRRETAQSDVVTEARWSRTPEQRNVTRAWLRKILPGTILLTVLVLLGALFPILF